MAENKDNPTPPFTDEQIEVIVDRCMHLLAFIRSNIRAEMLSIHNLVEALTVRVEMLEDFSRLESFKEKVGPSAHKPKRPFGDGSN